MQMPLIVTQTKHAKQHTSKDSTNMKCLKLYNMYRWEENYADMLQDQNWGSSALWTRKTSF